VNDADGQRHGWGNRIVGYSNEPPDQLTASCWNHRIHPLAQAKAVSAALETIGWIAPVIVNDVTGRVVDGHLRILQALEHGDETVPVAHVELTEDEERTAIATFDAIADMAVVDPDALRANITGLDLAGPLHDMLQAALGTPDIGGGAPEQDGNLPDPTNALTWGYATFGKTKVECSTGEVQALTRLWEDYKESNGGTDNGFVAFLTEVETAS
jgi:hypothetical protein